MNKKFYQYFSVLILTIHLLQSPVQATIFNSSSTLSENLTSTTLIACTVYVGYSYLTREAFLVKNTFPHAQKWYNHLAEKYPAAHLDTKKFIQKPSLTFIANILDNLSQQSNWISHQNHIYFSSNDLQEITYLYKKVIDGYPLDHDEKLALARQEFMLLHEAGHIEHHDATNIIKTIMGLLLVTHGPEFICTELDKLLDKSQADTTDTAVHKNNLLGYEFDKLGAIEANLLSTIGLPSQTHSVLATYNSATFIAGLISVLRYQEAQADKFAYTLADTQTLEGALTLFENDQVDPLFDLENKTMTPFIATDSSLGNIIQTIANPIEYIIAYGLQTCGLVIKSHHITRWIYDFSQNAIHQGPSIRAQLIKNEITARANKDSKR